MNNNQPHSPTGSVNNSSQTPQGKLVCAYLQLLGDKQRRTLNGFARHRLRRLREHLDCQTAFRDREPCDLVQEALNRVMKSLYALPGSRYPQETDLESLDHFLTFLATIIDDQIRDLANHPEARGQVDFRDLSSN
jgi:DNA-directed RNA polymerase specialized sigma24 family protein